MTNRESPCGQVEKSIDSIRTIRCVHLSEEQRTRCCHVSPIFKKEYSTNMPSPNSYKYEAIRNIRIVRAFRAELKHSEFRNPLKLQATSIHQAQASKSSSLESSNLQVTFKSPSSSLQIFKLQAKRIQGPKLQNSNSFFYTRTFL